MEKELFKMARLNKDSNIIPIRKKESRKLYWISILNLILIVGIYILILGAYYEGLVK